MTAGNTTNRTLSYRASKAIEIWLKNGRRSKARALRDAGYSEAVARHPEKVFGSRLAQEVMEGAGIKQRVEFKQIRQEIEVLENGGMVAVIVPPTPPILNLSEQQRRLLKAALASLPDPPATIQQEEVIKHDGYKYSSPTDPFEAGAATYSFPEPSSYSAM